MENNMIKFDDAMCYVGKFYGMMLFETTNGNYRIETYKDIYPTLEAAKQQIRQWKRKQ